MVRWLYSLLLLGVMHWSSFLTAALVAPAETRVLPGPVRHHDQPRGALSSACPSAVLSSRQSAPGSLEPDAQTSDLIRGRFFRDNIDKSVPGALIALYSADQDLLVDQTYSTDNGDFTLRAPQKPGRLYVVATKDMLSRRTPEFDYAPGTPQRRIWIRLEDRRSSLARAMDYVLTKLDYIATGFLGFLIGLATKLYEDRKLFGIQVNKLRVLRNDIRVIHSQLVNVIEQRRRLRGDDAAGRSRLSLDYSERLHDLEEPLAELELNKMDASVVYPVRGQRGLEQYHALQLAVKGIRKFIREGLDDFVNSPEEARRKKLEPFAKLESNGLLRK
jgi:hypothetical protein